VSQNLIQFFTALGGVLAVLPPIAAVVQTVIQTQSSRNAQPSPPGEQPDEQGDGQVLPQPGRLPSRQGERQSQWMVPLAFGSWLVAFGVASGATIYILTASNPVVSSSLVSVLRWLAGVIAVVSLTGGATGIGYAVWESAGHPADRHRADIAGGAASALGGLCVIIAMLILVLRRLTW
jgi:hypothetical protein